MLRPVILIKTITKEYNQKETDYGYQEREGRGKGQIWVED